MFDNTSWEVAVAFWIIISGIVIYLSNQAILYKRAKDRKKYNKILKKYKNAKSKTQLNRLIETETEPRFDISLVKVTKIIVVGGFIITIGMMLLNQIGSELYNSNSTYRIAIFIVSLGVFIASIMFWLNNTGEFGLI